MGTDFEINDLSDSALLCAVADGELSADDLDVAARIAQIPDAVSRIEAERRLRTCVARALGAPQVPASLRDRIGRALETEGAPVEVNTHAAPPEITRSPSFWRAAARYTAVAAMIALVGLVLVRGQGLGALPGTQRAQLISFVTDAHNDCASCKVTRGRRLDAATVNDALGRAESIIGSLPPKLAPALQAVHAEGLDFMGLGECNMPGPGGSVQLLFLDKPTSEYSSVFIQEDRGAITVIDSTCVYCRTRCKVVGDELAVWRRDGYIYYIYTADEIAGDIIRRAFATPTMRRRL